MSLFRRMMNRPVLQPTPVLPIYTPRRSNGFYADQHYLPLIRDQMVKANLNQRANFKCKSPAPHRSESSLSRSTTAGLTNSRQQKKSFNPLKVQHFLQNSIRCFDFICFYRYEYVSDFLIFDLSSRWMLEKS